LKNLDAQQMLCAFGASLKSRLDTFHENLAQKRLKQADRVTSMDQKIDTASRKQREIMDHVRQAQELIDKISRKQQMLIDEELCEVMFQRYYMYVLERKGFSEFIKFL